MQNFFTKNRLDYNNNIKNKIPLNIKSFWKHVNLLTKSNTLPNTFHHNNTYSTNTSDTCNLIANYFKSTYNYTNINPPVGIAQRSPPRLNLNSIEITVDDISKSISELDVNKGAGPDQIPNLFIKSCQNALSYPLCILFNKTLSNITFPQT